MLAMLRGVGKQCLGWLTMKAVEELLKGSGHLNFLVVLKASVQNLKCSAETFIFIYQLVGYVFDLPPCQSMQTGEQVDRRLLFLF